MPPSVKLETLKLGMNFWVSSDERASCPLIVSSIPKFNNFLINLLKPTGYYTYQQVQLSKILHADYTAFMCFVRISEETVTFALYTVNRLVFVTEVDSVYCAVRAESFRP